MDLIYIKIVLICLITIFVVGIVLTFILIHGQGKDPHGTHEGYSFLPRITPLLTILWVLSIMLYVFFTTIFENLWLFTFLNSDVFIFIGIGIAFLGLFICFLGIITLGYNFRMELPKEKTTLITKGVFHLMRNPIVFGLYLWLIGMFFIIPYFILLIEVILNIIAFDAKVRVEEKFLLQRFGKVYEEYKNKVGRYLPFPLKRTSLNI